MISNIRSKSIEGHITDSAGNILRNAQVIIQQPAPSGPVVIDTVISDDDGYFKSKPIPSGVYDVYESSVKVSRINHYADPLSIQCFKASGDNYNFLNLNNFSTLASSGSLNTYKSYIQIESDFIDILQYGNTYPIYNVDISLNPQLLSMSAFYGLTAKSRITTTRFDVEYYSPLTINSNVYKRIRWSGMPAIRFNNDTKLVIPLDYKSLVPSLPKQIVEAPMAPTLSSEGGRMQMSEADGSTVAARTFLNKLSVGSVLKLSIKSISSNVSVDWYGILNNVDRTLGAWTISLEKWLSSRITSSTTIPSSSNGYTVTMYEFDGPFQGMSEITEEVGSRFTVTENTSAQNSMVESYNY